MARSLNKAELIGNLTRDPELRYTPSGTAVCTFGLATNRQWTTESGEKREEAEFHRIVAWNKLAELCAQLLTKGRKVYVEGRIQTRRWTAQDGTEKTTTEIVIQDMIILDSRQSGSIAQTDEFDISVEAVEETPPAEGREGGLKEPKKEKAAKIKVTSSKEIKKEEKGKDEKESSSDEDIPF